MSTIGSIARRDGVPVCITSNLIQRVRDVAEFRHVEEQRAFVELLEANALQVDAAIDAQNAKSSCSVNTAPA